MPTSTEIRRRKRDPDECAQPSIASRKARAHCVAARLASVHSVASHKAMKPSPVNTAMSPPWASTTSVSIAKQSLSNTESCSAPDSPCCANRSVISVNPAMSSNKTVAVPASIDGAQPSGSNLRRRGSDPQWNISGEVRAKVRRHVWMLQQSRRCVPPSGTDETGPEGSARSWNQKQREGACPLSAWSVTGLRRFGPIPRRGEWPLFAHCGRALRRGHRRF